MSKENVQTSLTAVEQALEHFVSSLDRAGFAGGANAYRQMADIIVGQWIWAEQNKALDLQPRFLRIAELAAGVADQLRPYVAAMDQLRGLRGLVAAQWGIAPGSSAERVIDALTAADGGLTAAELRRATGSPTVAMRRDLDSLIDKGLVSRVEGTRGRFTLTGASRAKPRTS